MVPRGRTHPLATRVPPPHAGEARRCAHPGCITLLCGYNPGPRCYRHAPAETDAEYLAALDRELDREARRARRLARA